MSRDVPWQLGTTRTWDWQGWCKVVRGSWDVPWQLGTTQTWDWQDGVM